MLAIDKCSSAIMTRQIADIYSAKHENKLLMLATWSIKIGSWLDDFFGGVKNLLILVLYV